MKYCMNCGRQLPDTAKFCGGCGGRVEDLDDSSVNTGRKTVYVGAVYKCPNCGESLDSMTAICPACGYEIRNAKAVSSVQSFADQLAAIETERMPENDSPSLMKKLIGRDLRDRSEEVEAAREKFEAEKEARKISLISNYPVPNTKEDLVEFALLVTTNLQNKPDISTYSAWVNKLEQVYQKAQILIPNDPMFHKIEDLYLKAQKKIKTKKFLIIYGIVAFFAVDVLIFGFLANPTVTGIILGTIVIVGIIVWALIRQHRQNRRV